MGCNCGKNRMTSDGTVSAGSLTYKVNVAGRQVYESSNKSAADTVAGRFPSNEVIAPDGTTYSVPVGS